MVVDNAPSADSETETVATAAANDREHSSSSLEQLSGLDRFRVEWRMPSGRVRPITLLLARIDDFRNLVGIHGRFLADLWTRTLSEVIDAHARRFGEVYHLAEADFLIVLTGTKPTEAEDLGKELRTRFLHELPRSRDANQHVHLRTSHAISDDNIMHVDDLLRRVYHDLKSSGSQELDAVLQSNDDRAAAYSYTVLPDPLLAEIATLSKVYVAESKDWVRTGHILIVDDDEVSREVGANILTHHGYVVKTAASAHAAEELIRQRSFDLIVMDVHLQTHNGLQVVTNFRKRNLCRDAAILVATSDHTRATLYDALKIGVSAYILKPYRPGLLSEKVTEIIAEECLAKEMRVHPRFDMDVELPVQSLTDRFNPMDEPFWAQALDLSVSGIRLANSKSVRSRFLKLWIPLRNGKRMQTQIEVIRCRRVDDGFDVGGRFVVPIPIA